MMELSIGPKCDKSNSKGWTVFKIRIRGAKWEKVYKLGLKSGIKPNKPNSLGGLDWRGKVGEIILNTRLSTHPKKKSLSLSNGVLLIEQIRISKY